MAFDPKKCFIPTVYCGEKEQKYPYVENDNLYQGKGTSSQCMRKGFGASMAKEAKKGLPSTNLRQIRYVGETFEKNFKDNRIKDIPELIKYVGNHTAKQIETLLNKVFRNSNGTVNGKGYNSTLLYLYHNGNKKLPMCVNLLL